jgi:hypothetical protein
MGEHTITNTTCCFYTFLLDLQAKSLLLTRKCQLCFKIQAICFYYEFQCEFDRRFVAQQPFGPQPSRARVLDEFGSLFVIFGAFRKEVLHRLVFAIVARALWGFRVAESMKIMIEGTMAGSQP